MFDSGWQPELVIVEHSRGFGPSDISATTLVEKLFAYYAFAGTIIKNTLDIILKYDVNQQFRMNSLEIFYFQIYTI